MLFEGVCHNYGNDVTMQNRARRWVQRGHQKPQVLEKVRARRQMTTVEEEEGLDGETANDIRGLSEDLYKSARVQAKLMDRQLCQIETRNPAVDMQR